VHLVGGTIGIKITVSLFLTPYNSSVALNALVK